MNDDIRRRLGLELQRSRDLAGISGRQMHERIKGRVKVSQPTISRIDRGEAIPPMPVVRAWLDECDADDDTRTRVLELATVANGEDKRWRELLESEAHLQGRERNFDEAADRIQNFQPTVMPGLLQTASYAQAVLQLGRTDVPAAVAARLKRQELLKEPGRRFEFVVAERLLRWEPGPGALAGQAERLLSLAETVDLAVLPEGASPGLLVWNNFVIRRSGAGRPWVATELVHGAQEIRDPESVQIYERVWAQLWDASTHGADALALIRSTSATT